MRTFIVTVALAAVLAPAAALAADPPSQSAEQQCRAQRTGMGAAAFNALYGTNANKSNAFGKCVSKLARTKNEAELAAAVARIEQLVDRCKTDVAGHKDKRDKGDKGDKVKGHEKHGRHTSEAANGGHRGGDDHGGLKRFAGKRFAACLRDAV